MENFIKDAVRVFGTYFDKETHLPALLNVAWSVGRWDEAELRDAIRRALVEMLKGDDYKRDVEMAMTAFPARPPAGSVTELLIVLAWRESEDGILSLFDPFADVFGREV